MPPLTFQEAPSGMVVFLMLSRSCSFVFTWPRIPKSEVDSANASGTDTPCVIENPECCAWGWKQKVISAMVYMRCLPVGGEDVHPNFCHFLGKNSGFSVLSHRPGQYRV